MGSARTLPVKDAVNYTPGDTHELDALSHLIASTTQLDLHRRPGAQLAERIRVALRLEAVAIFDADLEETYQAGIWWPAVENQLRNVYIFETVREDPGTGLRQHVLRIGGLPIGSLMLRGQVSTSTMSAVAAMVAITFDRYHSFANETRTESARRAEQLRTTVLDHLAHAYKTPLTAIRAASSGLAETASFTPSQSTLLSVIEEQTQLLDRLTTQLLQTARLEAHDLALHSERISVLALVEEAVAAARNHLGDMPVSISVSPQDLKLFGDRSLLGAMLTQFVSNAGKYGQDGTTVTISAQKRGNTVVFSVHNLGPAIPANEQEHIFERYFRASGASRLASGTGIGLSIARQAAHAHGGDAWVTSNAEHGTTFYASVPVENQELCAS
jgi:two-component system, OmpR family, sensor histidine kinase KdpD